MRIPVFGRASALPPFLCRRRKLRFIISSPRATANCSTADQEFRFISWNIPNLLIVEDNFAWNAPNDWLLPDEFELNDALATVRQLGGTVVRSYSIPVQRADEDAQRSEIRPRPGKI